MLSIRYFTAGLILFTFLVGCQDITKTKKPKKLIPEEKMTAIVTDLVLMDAAMSVDFAKFKKTKLKPNSFIFEKYDVDSLTLLKNIEYYNTDFEANRSIYEQVKINIETKRAEFDSIKSVKDSLEQKDLKTEELPEN